MAAADYRLMTEATGQRIAAALESLVNLGDPVTIAHGGTGASTAAAALAALGGVAVTDIVDDLTSTATNKPLSAAQGKALNDELTGENITTYTLETGITLVSGGIVRIGSLVIIQMVLKSSNNLSASSILLNSIPRPMYTNGTGDDSVTINIIKGATHYSARTFHTSLYCNDSITMSSSDTITLSGVYISR